RRGRCPRLAELNKRARGRRPRLQRPAGVSPPANTRAIASVCKESTTATTNEQNNNQNLMPTMPPEAATRPKPKMPYSQDFSNLPKPVVPKTENRKLLKGQRAIVTGASSGIGRSIALALGHAGADVCVNYVAGEDKAQAMVNELRGHGHTAFAYRADVSSEEDVAKMFEAVRDEFGTVDILINNAGLQSDAPVDQM